MQRYFHEGAVMELVPGTKPVMKLVNAKNPIESIDAGKKKKIKINVLSLIFSPLVYRISND